MADAMGYHLSPPSGAPNDSRTKCAIHWEVGRRQRARQTRTIHRARAVGPRPSESAQSGHTIRISPCAASGVLHEALFGLGPARTYRSAEPVEAVLAMVSLDSEER